MNGKSILGLMMLAAGQGSAIEVVAQGPDAEAAVDAIKRPGRGEVQRGRVAAWPAAV